MFLKTLELFGFKSFADRTRIEFSDGITSLLGPNGSGKSNIVDAIKWVLGEQGVRSLRAERRDDVIFKGTDHRKPAQMAEVCLTIDNENRFLNIDLPEIELKRRLHRDGTSEYFINRSQVLLKNIKDLLMDTGVGKTAYSILEQGKIDQILSDKPEERRYVFEEAAGISRFKVQAQDAKRKLERTDENIAQTENVLREVKRTYDSRKVQMAKLKEYKALAAEKERTEIELRLSTLQAYQKVREMKAAQLQEAQALAGDLEARLEETRRESSEQEKVLQELRERRNSVMIEVSRLGEELKGRSASRDIYKAQLKEARARLEGAEERVGKFKTDMESKQVEAEALAVRVEEASLRIAAIEETVIQINKDMAALEGEVRACHAEIAATNEEAAALREARGPLSGRSSELSSQIAAELLTLVDESGYSVALRKETERKVIGNLSLMANILQENARTTLDLFLSDPEANKAAFVAMYRRIIDIADETRGLFQEYCGAIPTFIDELLKPDGILARKAALDSELEANLRGEDALLKKAALLEEKRDHQIARIGEEKNRLLDQQVALGTERAAMEGLQRLQRQIAQQLESRRSDWDEAASLLDAEQDRVNEILLLINQAEAAIEAAQGSLEEKRADLEDATARLAEESRILKERSEGLGALYDRLNEARSRAASLESDTINLKELIDKIHGDFFDQYGKSLREFDDHVVTEDVEVLKTALAEAKRKLALIPYVNQMAEQEFEEVKERYDFLCSNLADLEKAKADVQQVVEKIRGESETLFNSTFGEISKSFKRLFTRIFGGGEAELRLEDEEHPLESGIIILAQPPGKKLTYLPLLSGGERSMTAVALLFATYAVKPSPFCILDEIDAALDARNVGYFLSVLDEYAEASQFIIITHNKNTVLGSKCLLGVTQQEKGVSTMISYRLENKGGQDADVAEAGDGQSRRVRTLLK